MEKYEYEWQFKNKIFEDDFIKFFLFGNYVYWMNDKKGVELK